MLSLLLLTFSFIAIDVLNIVQKFRIRVQTMHVVVVVAVVIIR